MQQLTFIVLSNDCLQKNIFELKLYNPEALIIKPGQFVNILIPNFTLRRPLSVCDFENGYLSLVYKIVGEGTKALSYLKKDDTIDILFALGNGFDTSVSGESPLLIGGGLGVAPLLYLSKKLFNDKKYPIAILGFNSDDDIILIEKIKKYCSKIFVCALSSMNKEIIKGNVIDALKLINQNEYSYLYSCGPYNMMKAVNEETKLKAQFSFEERMGCGFGACMGCSHKTMTGYKRICKDGPVLLKEDILWQN